MNKKSVRFILSFVDNFLCAFWINWQDLWINDIFALSVSFVDKR